MAAAAAEERTVVLACNDFPPLKIENPGADGLQGSDVEVIEEIARRTGLHLEPRFMPWKRGYAEAGDGIVDGLCSCSFREDRTALFLFSEPIGVTSIGVFSAADRRYPPVVKIDDLKTHRVGVVKGYNLEDELADARIPYQAVSGDEQAYQMLLKKRFDHLYSFAAPINFILRDSSTRDIAYTELRSSPYFLCLSRKVPDTAAMLPRINAAIAEMRADGTFGAIHRRYGQDAIN